MNTEGSLKTELTLSGAYVERCASPFCDAPLPPRRKHGRKAGRRFCGQACRNDGHVLKRAEEMLAEMGIVRFSEILGEWR